MITLKQAVHTALTGACETVIYGWPRDFTGDAFIAWRETGSREYAQADAAEYLAELTYALDIFARTPEDTSGLLSEADSRMQSAGFRRQSAAELYDEDTRFCRISARYRALADAAGNIYQ